jgi:hypothetical protein
MRLKQRIRPFLRRINVGVLIAHVWKKEYGGPEEALKYQKQVEDFIYSDKFLNFWEKRFALRFCQALVNHGYPPFDMLYHYEEHELLKLCGYNEAERTLLRLGYTEDDTKLNEPIYLFVDELESTYLKKMIEDNNSGVREYSNRMLKIFEQELHARGFTNIK